MPGPWSLPASSLDPRRTVRRVARRCVVYVTALSRVCPSVSLYGFTRYRVDGRSDRSNTRVTRENRKPHGYISYDRHTSL